MGIGSVEGQGGAVKRGGEGNNRGREYNIFDASRALEICRGKPYYRERNREREYIESPKDGSIRC